MGAESGRPFVDAASFSCVTGIRKPDAAAYLMATDRLRVAPEDCVYVGDGGSHELAGARTLGMQAVMYAPTDATDSDAVADPQDSWRGPTIVDLRELPRLIARRT